MAGKIVADTLEHSTAGSVTTDYVVNGSVKMWVNFDGTASDAAARDSFNVASMADDGSGLYTVNLTNAMNNSNYCITGSSSYGSTPRGHSGLAKRNSVDLTTTALKLAALYGATSTSNGGVGDEDHLYSTISGDIA